MIFDRRIQIQIAQRECSLRYSIRCILIDGKSSLSTVCKISLLSSVGLWRIHEGKQTRTISKEEGKDTTRQRYRKRAAYREYYREGKIPLEKGVEKELLTENSIGRERYH